MRTEKKILFLALCLFMCLIIVSGCSVQKEYSYEEIQKEYADVVCGLSPEKTDGAAPGKCAVNRPVSLAEAVKIAMTNNPNRKMAFARIRQAEAMIDQANAAFLPFAGFYTEYTRADAPSVYLFKTIDQRELPAGTNFNDPGSVKNFETGINAGINLYNGGRDILNRKMAETGLTISQLDRESIENAMIASVIQIYYDALAAEDFIKIADESVSTVKKELKIMKVRLKGGSVLKSDVLSLEVRLAQSKEEVVRSRNRFKIAINALANIMGVSPETGMTLKPSDAKLISIPEEYNAGMEYGLKNRTDLKKEREQVRVSRMGIDMARSQYMPRVDLKARYYLDDESLGFDTERDNWMAAVILNWDIFTGFSTRALVNKASAMLEEALGADRRADLSMKMDVKNAYLNLESARARLKVARSSVKMAEESLNLVRKQYEGGSANITRYLEAELDRNRSRIRAAAAFYDQEKAIADIGRAIGYWGKTKEIQ